MSSSEEVGRVLNDRLPAKTLKIEKLGYNAIGMKLALTIWLLISFIGMAGLGFLIMDHGIERVPTGCLAATSQVANCQENSNGFLTFNFHFGIFRSFSNATLSQIAILALLLLAAA